jgi:hypothetical protein
MNQAIVSYTFWDYARNEKKDGDGCRGENGRLRTRASDWVAVQERDKPIMSFMR